MTKPSGEGFGLSRKGWIALAIAAFVALMALATLTAFHLAARSLKQSVIAMLGPESEVAELSVGLTRVTISGIRVRAPRGWPVDTTLRAERVVIVPDLRELVARRVHVDSVRIEKGYISALRPARGGGLKLLPGLLDGKRDEGGDKASRAAKIRRVELDDCIVELFDATLASRQKLRVEAVHGSVLGIELPELDSRIAIALDGIVADRRATSKTAPSGATKAGGGTLAVRGWVNVARASSDLETRVRGVRLAQFQPYLLQKLKAGVDHGSFDLDLDAKVRNKVVAAHGILTLRDLKLAAGDSLLADLANIPRQAVLGALADKDERLRIEFELKGRLDNPAFSLAGGAGLLSATALLQTLGLGFEALVRVLFSFVSGFAGAFSGG